MGLIMQISELNTLFKETNKAIQRDCPGEARMHCNRILAFLAPYDNRYAQRMEAITKRIQYELKTKWHKPDTKQDMKNVLACVIRESQTQMNINRSA